MYLHGCMGLFLQDSDRNTIQSLFLAVAADWGRTSSINGTSAGHHSSPRQFMPAFILGYNCPVVSLYCGTRGLDSESDAAWQVSLSYPSY